MGVTTVFGPTEKVVVLLIEAFFMVMKSNQGGILMDEVILLTVVFLKLVAQLMTCGYWSVSVFG